MSDIDNRAPLWSQRYVMQGIRTRWIAATNTQPDRIKAETASGNKLTIPYPHERRLNQADSHRVAAEMLASKLGWSHDGQCRAVLVQSSATYDGCCYQFSLLHERDLQDAAAAVLSRTA